MTLVIIDLPGEPLAVTLAEVAVLLSPDSWTLPVACHDDVAMVSPSRSEA